MVRKKRDTSGFFKSSNSVEGSSAFGLIDLLSLCEGGLDKLTASIMLDSVANWINRCISFWRICEESKSMPTSSYGSTWNCFIFLSLLYLLLLLGVLLLDVVVYVCLDVEGAVIVEMDEELDCWFSNNLRGCCSSILSDLNWALPATKMKQIAEQA